MEYRMLNDDKYSASTIGCGECGTHNPFREFAHWFNVGIIIILVVGLVLGTYLISHKHKGEKGLRKKCLLWDLIYFIIVMVLWLIVNYILWRIQSIDNMIL